MGFCGSVEGCWNVMAHAQKTDFVFRRNGRVHLNLRGASVQSNTGSRGVRICGSRVRLKCDGTRADTRFGVNKNPTRWKSMQIFIYCKVTLHVSGVTAPIISSTKNCNRSLLNRSLYWYSYFPLWPDQAMLEGSSCTSIMTCTGGCGYSF